MALMRVRKARAALLVAAGLLLFAARVHSAGTEGAGGAAGAALGAGAAAEAGFEALRQGPVTVLHAPADAGFARAVAEKAVFHHERIRRDLGLQRQVEVSLLLLTGESPEEAREEWKRRLPPWLAGAAVARDQFIVLRVQPGQTPRDLDPLVAHELTHVILKADFPRSADWPLWFQEGLAMRASGTEGLQHFGTLSVAALRGRLLPLASLRHRFPVNQAESRLAYAESYSFLAFVIGRRGHESFERLMRELRRESFEEAFSDVYGAGVSTLEEQWLRWVNRRYAWIPAVTGGTAFSALMVFLFFVALGVRRRKSRLLREGWEREELEDDAAQLLREAEDIVREHSRRIH